ncbi:hypothetical protein [Rhizobium calliandrae]|uniref:ATP dependent DNA ligase n=1 Tax=Rhizobium calliandrae TaxID=1312182 RepID=UPI0032E4689E
MTSWRATMVTYEVFIEQGTEGADAFGKRQTDTPPGFHEPSSSALGGIGRLLLAAYKGNELVYVGWVGTGFKERATLKLRKDLDTLTTLKPAVALKRKGVVWVQPSLIAEIQYRAWTHDGMLRQASYKGLRERQDNAEVYRIEPPLTTVEFPAQSCRK